jgi:hypothetical protein
MFTSRNLAVVLLGLIFSGIPAIAKDGGLTEVMTKTEQGVQSVDQAKNEATSFTKETKSLFHTDKNVKKADGTETTTSKDSTESTTTTTTAPAASQ